MVGVGWGGGLPCWDCSTSSGVPQRRGTEMPFLFPGVGIVGWVALYSG